MPGFFYKQSPYNPASDWRTYFAQGIENMIGGLMQGQERKLQGQDIQNISDYIRKMQTSPGAMPTPSGTTTMADLQNLGQFVTGAKAPELPIARTNIGQQLITSLLMGQMQTPLQKAQTEHYQIRTEDLKQQPKSKIQELIKEGYTPQEAKHIRDIFHGLKPRASATKSLAQKSLPEQLSFWQTVYNKSLDPEWGGMKPTADMDDVRYIARQNIDRITGAMRAETEVFTQPQQDNVTGSAPPITDEQLLSNIAKMKVGDKFISPQQNRDIIRKYPTLAKYLPQLSLEEQQEVLGAINDGMTEEEILKFFK